MSTLYLITEVVRTKAPIESVIRATKEALLTLGGDVKVYSKSHTILIRNGKSLVGGDLLFDCNARIRIKKKGEGKYLIKCDLEKRPSSIFWLILLGGMCLPTFLWIGNIYYFFIDLGDVYRKRLELIEPYI